MERWKDWHDGMVACIMVLLCDARHDPLLASSKALVEKDIDRPS